MRMIAQSAAVSQALYDPNLSGLQKKRGIQGLTLSVSGKTDKDRAVVHKMFMIKPIDKD